MILKKMSNIFVREWNGDVLIFRLFFLQSELDRGTELDIGK